jgi:hypothetical protein
VGKDLAWVTLIKSEKGAVGLLKIADSDYLSRREEGRYGIYHTCQPEVNSQSQGRIVETARDDVISGLEIAGELRTWF